MSNKSDHTDYFREIIRRLKKMETEFTEDPTLDVYSESGDRVGLMELPFPPEMFDRLSADEKETLYIWLNRRNIPQA
jgi:hypothetical protein